MVSTVPLSPDPIRTLPIAVDRYTDTPVFSATEDLVAVEEPLEIQLRYPGDPPTTLAVVMRTPGDDLDLTVGFLLGERVIESMEDIVEVREAGIGRNRANVVIATLAPTRAFDPRVTDRFGVTSSACGVCGTTAIDVVGSHLSPLHPTEPRLDPDVIRGLPGLLSAVQGLFAQTGGTHAAGLTTSGGELVLAREDVGRHFALDKAIGAALRTGTPTGALIAVTSARASFELVQKALLAKIPALVALGPPSSLAIRMAAEHGLTLVGFAADDRFNLYAGRARVQSVG